MSESVHLETLARPDLNGELRVTLEKSDKGRAIVARLWRRDGQGLMRPTRFGVSIRTGEIRRVVKALERAEDMTTGQWTFWDGNQQLTASQRIDSFLEDVGAPPRKKF